MSSTSSNAMAISTLTYVPPLLWQTARAKRSTPFTKNTEVIWIPGLN